MPREIKPIGCKREALTTAGLEIDPGAWFSRQPSVGSGSWFLAHADDGILWGQIRNGALVVSSQPFAGVSPPLRAVSLQQARLFGEAAEVRVWKEGQQFRACRLEDCDEPPAETLDEEHLLWGTQIKESKDEFSLVIEGRQGLYHAVPLPVPPSVFGDKHHPLRLMVRHYLAYDEHGQIRIALSRLVALRAVPKGALS